MYVTGAENTMNHDAECSRKTTSVKLLMTARL